MNVEPHILTAAVSGNARALEAVVQAIQRPLYNLALRTLGTHADAEDATQELLLRIVTHLGSFRGESRFSTWVWTIAVRGLREIQRRQARQPIPIDGFEADLAHARDDQASERLEDRVMLAQVKLGCGRAMLQCLDEELRLAYVLGEILEVPGPEAAQALGIAPDAWRKRLSRARTRVQHHLRQVCGLVETDNPCRCHRRLAPARALGRLDPRDAEAPIDLDAVRAQVAAVEAIDRHRAYYLADPTPDAPEGVVERVRRTLTPGSFSA